MLIVGVIASSCVTTDDIDNSVPSTSTASETSIADFETTTAVTVEPMVIRVLTSADTFPAGFTVPEGELWTFDADTTTTLEVSGNVIVRGVLQMTPVSADIEHTLRFIDIDEEAFVGGGFEPVASDVGLWVAGAGRLDLQGTEKASWDYEYDSSWTGDEVIAAPNSLGDYESFETVTATPPTNALGYATELMNLTRNVRIEGTPEGYSHVFVRSSSPQTIRFVAIRYVGPDPEEFAENDSTGRYGLHFHHSGDGSRGTIVEGVVIRDTANHAFVPHASHGITFRDTIAFDVASEAYWWDDPPEDDLENPINDTEDLTYERAIAARVVGASGGNNHRLAAFYLGRGTNVTVTDSVAVGLQQERGADRSGFLWPENSEATWTFTNNIAHNNETNGIFVWQNNELTHLIEGFTAYYNDQAGINHGAYRNAYEYRDVRLLENGTAIISHALGKAGPTTDTQVWEDVGTDGGAMLIERHNLDADAPVRFLRCDLAEVVVQDDGSEPGLYDFIECGLEPADFDLDDAHRRTIIRVQRADGTAYSLTGAGTITEIAAFYTGP